MRNRQATSLGLTSGPNPAVSTDDSGGGSPHASPSDVDQAKSQLATTRLYCCYFVVFRVKRQLDSQHSPLRMTRAFAKNATNLV